MNKEWYQKNYQQEPYWNDQRHVWLPSFYEMSWISRHENIINGILLCILLSDKDARFYLSGGFWHLQGAVHLGNWLIFVRVHFFEIIANSTLRISNCTLFAAHCYRTLNTAHCTLYASHCTLYAIHCYQTLNILYWLIFVRNNNCALMRCMVMRAHYTTTLTLSLRSDWQSWMQLFNCT